MKEDMDKSYWDTSWKDTENTVSERTVYYMIDTIKLEYLLSLLENGKRDIKILEVGCGSARLSCFLASYGYKNTCLDYSKSALEVAKNNFILTNNNGNFVLGDVKNLPFKDDSYDVVISTGLLEHFRNPQIVVDEMVRVLKPEGLFFSDIVPKKFSLLGSLDLLVKLILLVRRRRKADFYEKKLNRTDIEHLLQSANLEDIKVFAGGIVPPWIFFSKRIPIGNGIKGKMLSLIKPLSKRLDNTLLAELVGFHYISMGYKKDRKR